ncbi:MAG: hypothetical protein KAI79_09855, partial [Bacteroidales bacterium]|nr:hypothetical protein [Bacteroidales bacterium]
TNTKEGVSSPDLTKQLKSLLQPKLSPYSYITSLKDESRDDEIFQAIREICNDVLINETKYDDDDIEFGLNFLNTQSIYLKHLRETLGLIESSNHFVNLGHNMDLLLVVDEVNFDYRSNQQDLSILVNLTLQQIEIYTIILSKLQVK